MVTLKKRRDRLDQRRGETVETKDNVPEWWEESGIEKKTTHDLRDTTWFGRGSVMEWARMAASGNRRLVSTDDVTAVHPEA